jgi:hypothetical protein
MKHTLNFLIILITVLVCSCVFAEIHPDDGQHVMESKGFKGQVESIIRPEAYEAKQEMIVTNDKGERMSFLLTSGIGVYSPGWEVLNLKKIKPGDKVLVEYATNKKGDANRAISIMLKE